MTERKNIIGNLLFIAVTFALIGLIFYFFKKENAGFYRLSKNDAGKPFSSSAEISFKNRLNRNSSQIKIFKNSIEKILESASISVRLTARDCREIKKTSLAIENLLEEMSAHQFSPDFIAQINAADEIRKLVFLETAKFEAFLKDQKTGKAKIRNQLFKLEENLYKLELHLNALSEHINRK